MKKHLTDKKMITLLIAVVALVVLAGCQSNVDKDGHVLAEKIIYLTTPWSAMTSEGILSFIFVYPLAQCINFIGTHLNSAVLGVVITTLLYNVITLGLSIKSTVSGQKLQMLQPEMNKIQAKYEGKTDDRSRMAMGQEMQALYTKHGINPLSSLVTPFLTFPIMIAMYYAAQRADVVVRGTFLGIPLETTPLAAFRNIKVQWPIAMIFVLMMIMQFISVMLPQKLAERRRKAQKNYKAYADDAPKNNSMNAMLYGTLIMIGVLGIRWPSAMSVYWGVSSFANICKTLFIQRRYIDK